MYKLFEKEQLGPNVYRLWIEAPRVAKARQPGQFVMVRMDEKAERIPLTIADVDVDRGRISLIIQSVGVSTCELCALCPGEGILDVAGPLGLPTELEEYEHAVVVGGGVGTAVVYPQAAALKDCCRAVTAIIGGRTKELVILEDQLAPIVTDLIVCTDDGSYGRKGFVTTALQDLIENEKEGKPVNAVYTAGPVPMMKAIAELTRPHKIKTIVSVNPVMVDGTGMCGGCRVTVHGETFFACADGPEFDGHGVDFDQLADRLTTYHRQEQQLADWHEAGQCRLNNQVNSAGDR